MFKQQQIIIVFFCLSNTITQTIDNEMRKQVYSHIVKSVAASYFEQSCLSCEREEMPKFIPNEENVASVANMIGGGTIKLIASLFRCKRFLPDNISLIDASSLRQVNILLPRADIHLLRIFVAPYVRKKLDKWYESQSCVHSVHAQYGDDVFSNDKAYTYLKSAWKSEVIHPITNKLDINEIMYDYFIEKKSIQNIRANIQKNILSKQMVWQLVPYVFGWSLHACPITEKFIKKHNIVITPAVGDKVGLFFSW